MAETTTTPQSGADTKEKTPGNIVSRGASEPVTFTQPGEKTPDENSNGAAAAAVTETAEEKTTREAAATADKNKLPELSDDQLKELLKGKGIELDDKGFDGLKEKLKPAAAAPEPTEAEKQKAEAEFDKRKLDHFLKNGGTVEQWVGMKKIAAADLKELSKAEIKQELKEAGFKDEELESTLESVLKERYYQIKLDELEQGENETTEQFDKRKGDLEKKITFFSKKLENKSSYRIEQAKNALKLIDDAVKEEDDAKQEEIKNSQRVDDFFKILPRKLTFELGKIKDLETTPITYDVSETDIAEVTGILKDPEKRNKFLYNEDNSLNLDNLAGVMLRNKYLEGLVKDAYIQGDDSGSDREVAKFEKIFPGRIAKEIGVGGAAGGGQGGRKGHIVSRGEPEPVVR